VTVTEVATVVVQIAPFVAIIAVEALGQGFDRRFESTVRQYEQELAARPPVREEFVDLACHSFDHENAVQHLDLAIISLVVLFVGRVVGAGQEGVSSVVGIVFLGTVIFVFAVRWWVEGYFQRRSPPKYYVEDTVAGVHYGPLVVVASNLVVVAIIVVLETVV
jgi:hypothetical protein